MTAFLTQRIKDREQKIERLTNQIRNLQRDRRLLQAELKAYQDVLFNGLNTNADGDAIDREGEDVEQQSAKTSRMSDTWKGILLELIKIYPNPSSVDDIRIIVKNLGRDMSDESLRSQLSIYTARGWLDRVSIGNYRISKAGAMLLGIHLPSDQEEETDEFDNLI